jgi:hypothetical protein
MICDVPSIGSLVSGNETNCPERTAKIEDSYSLLKTVSSSEELVLTMLPLLD